VLACLAAAALNGSLGALAADGTVNLLFDGDSISAGVGAPAGQGLDTRVAAAFGPAVRLHNVAVGGRPVHECLRLYPVLADPLFAPDCRTNVIVFHAGDNDIRGGFTAEQTYRAFTAYVGLARVRGWKLVVSTELRLPAAPPATEAALADYNDRLRANTAGADAVVDFDLDPRMVDPSYRHDPALFTGDLVHPNAGGYAVLAAMLIPAVRRVVAGSTG
jgi:lysophospholipase L1-like esterase